MTGAIKRQSTMAETVNRLRHEKPADSYDASIVDTYFYLYFCKKCQEYFSKIEKVESKSSWHLRPNMTEASQNGSKTLSYDLVNLNKPEQPKSILSRTSRVYAGFVDGTAGWIQKENLAEIEHKCPYKFCCIVL